MGALPRGKADGDRRDRPLGDHEIDLFDWQDAVAGMLTVAQLEVELAASEGLVRRAVERGQVAPDHALTLGDRTYYYFSRERIPEIGRIGKAAGIIVEDADERTGRPIKYATAHDLRRSCSERLREAGVPPLVICRVMRHSSWETTQKHYAPGNTQKDAEILATILSRSLAHQPLPNR